MAAAKVARVKKQLSNSISELLNAHRKSQVNVSDNNGMSSLHQAALMGNLQLMKMLIYSNVNVDAQDAKGMTALHYSTFHNSPETSSLLLQNGAQVDIANKDGNTALHFACQHGQLQTISLLLYYRADPTVRNKQSISPFDAACEYGKCKAVDILMESGFQLNSFLSSVDFSEPTCLHLAARNGHLEVLRKLLDGGCDINQLSCSGTCLHEAATNGRVEVLRFLLQNGADPEAKNASGHTAFDVVKKLISHNNGNANLIKVKLALKEAQNAVYGRALCDHCARFEGELSFNYGDVIWIVDRSNEFVWKGVIFGRNTSSRVGQFPVSAVQIVDRKSGIMQRSASQRQVKKVNVPVVPDVSGIMNGSEAGPQSSFVANPLTARLQSTSSCSSWPQVDPDTSGSNSSRQNNQNTNLINSCQTKTSKSSQNMASSSYLNGCSYTRPLNDGVNVLNNSSNILNSPARHRNSTGSNSSQSSSGFESMKSGSQANTNATVHNFRGDSPPSRNSVHSSGSSSLGSLERLDESGYASHINIAEMALNGVPDQSILSAWLQNLHYEEYLPLFLNAGYDLSTVARMTPEDLTAIGITKPGHRKRLTTEIHKMNIADGWPDKKPSTLCEWLHALSLLEYVPLFEAQGYGTMDEVVQLTWEDFEDVGVKKLGHLKKLVCAIKKIKDARLAHSATTTDPNFLAGVGEVLLINVPPQRTTAEVRPYTHLTHGGQHSPQTMSTFQHSPRALSASQETLMYRPELVQINSAHLSPAHHRQNGQNTFFANSNYSHLTSDANGYDTFPPWRTLEKPNSARSQHENVANLFNGHNGSNNFVTTEAIVHHDDQRPKVQVKPRPVAKIIAKTKRGSRDVPHDITCYQEHVSLSCEDLKCPKIPLVKGYANVDVGSKFNQNESALIYEYNDSRQYPTMYSSHTLTPQLKTRNPQNGRQQFSDESPRNAAIRNGHCKSNDVALVPPQKPPPPQAQIFQLSSHPCLDDSFELSPAPSVDEFPPPPCPIMCEEHIRNLRSIRDNPKTVTDDCLSQCGEHEASSMNNEASTSSTTGTIVRRRVQDGNMGKQNRNDSTASVDSNSSTETLPFANENVGTIKQKNGMCAGGPVASNCSAPSSQNVTPRRHVSDVFNNGVGHVAAQKQCTSNKQLSTVANGTKPGDVLNDIGFMLQDLTEQLDAMLCEPTSTH